MKHLVLHRIALNEYATYGVLINDVNNTPFAVTLELPWLNNEQSISCIPFGFYNCKRIISPSHGDVFEILNVRGRKHILFHKGNTVKDSLGCILPVSNITVFDGKIGGTSSKFAYDRLMNLLHAETFILKIERTL